MAAIPLTGTGGLFTQLGVIGALIYREQLQQIVLATRFNNLPAQYAEPNTDLLAPVMPNVTAWSAIPSGMVSALTQLASNTLIRQVFVSAPSQSGTVLSCLQELVRQMNAATASVQRCTVGASAAAVAGIKGDGILCVSSLGSNGLPLENIVAEIVAFACTQDAQTGSAAVGNETFSYTGQPIGNDPTWYQWPQGSAATGQMNAVSALRSATAGNLLVNGGFDAFTTNVPNNWICTVGTPGTDLKIDTSVVYSGPSALQLVGNAGGTAVKVAINQQFNTGSTTVGSTLALSAQNAYGFSYRIYADVVPAAGVITFSLIGGATTGTMSLLTDTQGNNCSFTISLPGIAANTTWYAKTGVLRTPQVMPAVYAIQVAVTTAISTSTNIYLDHMAMSQLTTIYPGGPGVTIFSGATPFIQNNDRILLTDTNDYGGGSNNGSTFQILFDRLFNTSGLGILLPSLAVSPTVPDSLITT